MELGFSELIAAVIGLSVAGSTWIPKLFALRKRRGHQHEFDHFGMDGVWRCRTCEAPKAKGS